MTPRVHIVEDMTNDTLLVDNEGRANIAEFFCAILVAKLADAIFAADFTADIGQQAHRQAMLVAKLGVIEAVVPTAAVAAVPVPAYARVTDVIESPLGNVEGVVVKVV